jgi:hypothetical protein
MVELGRIEKPTLDSFAGKRKLYIVRSLNAPDGSTDEFRKLIQKYWDDIVSQVGKLEAAGKIKKIFCEHILSADASALEEIAAYNERAAELIRAKSVEGAIIFPLEKEEIYGPLIDWRNCLEVVVTSEVFEQVLGFYDLVKKRLEHIQKVIEEGLDREESGLLLTTEELKSKVLFADDIELFSVTPPSYEDLLRQARKEKNSGRKDENQ